MQRSAGAQLQSADSVQSVRLVSGLYFVVWRYIVGAGKKSLDRVCSYFVHILQGSRA